MPLIFSANLSSIFSTNLWPLVILPPFGSASWISWAHFYQPIRILSWFLSLYRSLFFCSMPPVFASSHFNHFVEGNRHRSPERDAVSSLEGRDAAGSLKDLAEGGETL